MSRDEWFFNLISRYKFALAFENCRCTDYVTEKVLLTCFCCVCLH